MSLLALLRRARVSAGLAAGAAALTAVPLVTPAARADTTGSAQQQVASVLAKVHGLQARALAAEKQYGDAFAAVSNSVTAAVSADQANQTVQAQAAHAQQELADRARDLYESGGPLAVYASFLTSASVNDFADRDELASRIVAEQAQQTQAATTRAAAFAADANQAARSEQHRIATARTIATAASRVQALLDHERALLAAANQHLAAVQQAQAALGAATSAFGSIATAQIAQLHVLPPSAQYLSLYQHAATTCPGLSWTVLAAIGQVESGHGRNPSTSSAGAQGPMQFMPATFAHYAVDGDHDGTANIMSPADSIYTAARYLCADGASSGPAGLSGAILHYNHAAWYVAMVLKLAGLYASSYS